MDTKDKPILNLHRDVDTFTRAYIEAALWSSLDDADEPMDRSYSWADLAPQTLAKMVSDCKAFREQNRAHLEDYPDTNAGHDFWLTRCGHGAGFRENDFSTEEHCAALTESAHKFGNVDLYVGDDGQLGCAVLKWVEVWRKLRA